jgi:hypothetical protein
LKWAVWTIEGGYERSSVIGFASRIGLLQSGTSVALWLGLGGVIRPADRFPTSSRADFAMRGFAISSWTTARVASSDSFLVFFFLIENP